MAKQLGADHTILITPKSNVDTLVQEVQTLLDGEGSEVTYECTGIESSTRLAIYGIAIYLNICIILISFL